MKAFLPIILLLISGVCHAKWKFEKKYGPIPVYKSENSTILSVEFNERKKGDMGFARNYISEFETKKPAMMGILGVTNWKLTGKKRFGKGRGTAHFQFRGSYVDNSGALIYFTEYHYFTRKKSVKINLINSSQKKLMKDSKPSKVAGFRKKYGV